jgi:hypothetical protein
MPDSTAPEDTPRSAYREYLAEREAILHHRRECMERDGRDPGFEAALVQWAAQHHAAWRRGRTRQERSAEG